MKYIKLQPVVSVQVKANILDIDQSQSKSLFSAAKFIY